MAVCPPDFRSSISAPGNFHLGPTMALEEPSLSPRSGRLLTSTFIGSVTRVTNMKKFYCVFIFVVAIGLANDIANTALAGPHSNDVYQGNNNQSDDDGGDDDQNDDDDDGVGDDQGD